MEYPSPAQGRYLGREGTERGLRSSRIPVGLSPHTAGYITSRSKRIRPRYTVSRREGALPTGLRPNQCYPRPRTSGHRRPRCSGQRVDCGGAPVPAVGVHRECLHRADLRAGAGMFHRGAYRAPRVDRRDRRVGTETPTPHRSLRASAKGFIVAARDTPNRSTYIPFPPLQAGSNAGCTLATTPQSTNQRAGHGRICIHRFHWRDAAP
jgi:hypothetical protein